VEDYTVGIDSSPVPPPPPPASDFVLDMLAAGFQNGAADTIDVFVDPGTGELVVLVDGTVEKLRGLPSTISSLTIKGSTDNDSLRVSGPADPGGRNIRITGSQVAGLFGLGANPDISFQNIESLQVTGTPGNDMFDVHAAPAGGAIIRIDGGLPPAIPNSLPLGDTVGDKLTLDMSATTGPVIVCTINGTATSASHQPVNFTQIEDLDLIDGNALTNVQMGDLYVRGTEGNDIIQFANGGTNLSRTRINNFIITLPVTMKTVAYGRGGIDYLQQTNLAKPAEFYGEGGDDYLSGYTAADLLVGGAGNDRLLGGDGDNELWGDNLGEQDLASGGNDILSGGNGNEKMYGGGGNDQMNAMGGNDYVYGGAGDDTADGGEGDDRLYGGDGNDTLTGGAGNDLIAGGAGNDQLYGKDGNDVLIGGTGADLLLGENGNDLLFDGNVSYDDPGTAPPAGSDDSHAFGDASDLAMTALLADWSSDNLIAAAFLAITHDSFLDTLSGGDGADTASPGSGDTGDWELLI
jgi:Ca2+-binding RTX toxin-like protein